MELDSRVTSDPTRLTLTTCNLEIFTTPNAVTVSIAGELDMADAEQVGQALIEAAMADIPIVRLELSQLTFADSSAIKAILLGARAAAEHGVTYELLNPHGRVQRLLQVTGLTDALTIVVEPDDEQGPNSA
jgi:anti-sigma B factor antagonist